MRLDKARARDRRRFKARYAPRNGRKALATIQKSILRRAGLTPPPQTPLTAKRPSNP